MNETTNVASLPYPATHTSRMQILQFEQSNYILNSQTKPSFPCKWSNCYARCQCYRRLPAESDSPGPFYQVRFCVRRGRGCAHTSPQRDTCKINVYHAALAPPALVQLSSKLTPTHLAQKNQHYLLSFRPLVSLQIIPPARKSPTRNGKGGFSRSFCLLDSIYVIALVAPKCHWDLSKHTGKGLC